MRRGGLSPRGRGRGAGGSPRPRITIESSSESDPLPELETRASTESVHILGDYYSEEESYSQSYDSNEHDWKSHSPKPQPPRPAPPPSDANNNRRQRPTPPPSDPNRVRRSIPSQNRRPLPKPQNNNQNNVLSPKKDESDEYPYSSYEDGDDGAPALVQNSHNEPGSSENLITDEDKNQLSNQIGNNQNTNPQNTTERTIESQFNSNQQQNQPNSPQSQKQPNQPQMPPNQPQMPPNQPQIPPNQPQMPPNQSPISASQLSELIRANEQTFQISYERAINLWRRPVQMTKNDVLVYCSHSAHDKQYGKVHFVYNKNPSKSSSQPLCMIVRNRNGTCFTILDKPSGSDTPHQLAGISFIDLPGDDSRIRFFRVAIPIEGCQYIPSTKDEDLARVANIGQVKPNVQIWSSALPKKHKNGKLTLDMGPYQVKRSLKNFIIRDDKDNIMFLIFKSFDGVCKIKASPPFTPIIAFGLGVAILTSMK